ncbi:MAG TPA: hypothetical protein VE779_10595 [Candidatus Angelobacter sp.]|jgi:hypothetical protein|nr:hypothetical protein [Candidatus Angelobacter sp.]
MKNLRMMLVLVGLVVLVASISAVAQVGGSTGSATEVKFTSKMAFNVGDKAMPPGEYVFRNGGGINATTCTVTGGKNESLVQCHISKIDGVTKQTEATFRKVGDTLYLDAIKFPTVHEKSTTMIFRIEPTAAEAAAAKAASK